MKEVKYEDWIKGIKELNKGQPDLMDLVQQQIDSYEADKNKDYAVIDSRNNAIYFEGTQWECMKFLNTNYPENEIGSEHMKVGINWSIN
ncbi:hypothetical protein SAMN05421676_102339 [Salinibacillus kushneri]|uniref:Uncharacterized protein n=1 Tax=Salinibacillus kushneri TaxID=237682 RepID=A0A1I0B4A2_9BACI|nr:hypothetical protein [Salinibacillus kushneri]SET01195.1 hypothetical protein SAMN05421676_102339 [Salinibacillus kushneri]